MPELTETAQRMIADLRQLRDSIRVRIHLAGMEAKDAWEKIEPKLDQLERDLDKNADTIAESIMERLEALRGDIEKVDEDCS